MTKPRIAQNIETARDVVLLRLDKRRILVVGCDSIGAVGLKPLDALRVRPETVGKFAARVALMEVISVGAKPICISVALCVEPAPTGRAIMNGVRGELRASGLESVSVVQSSEKNFPVKQTSVGTTVNGIAEKRQLRIGRCKPDDWLVTVGTPTVGRDVVKAERTGSIADLRDIFDLLDLGCVHEIIPVGSRGIFREARTIAMDSRLSFSPTQNAKVNVEKSAGPATAIICAIKPGKLSELSRTIDKPLSFIGELR
jgi:hypothetical protein